MNPDFADEDYFEDDGMFEYQRQLEEEQRREEEEIARLDEIDRQLAIEAEMENRDNWNDDSDEYPSIYDNPYYNEDLDMDQQSPDFWDSL